VQKSNGPESEAQKQRKRASTIPVIRAPRNEIKSPRSQSPRIKLPKLGGDWKGYLNRSVSSAISSITGKPKSEWEEGRRKTVNMGTSEPSDGSDVVLTPEFFAPAQQDHVAKGPSWKLSERRNQTRRTRNSVFKSLANLSEDEKYSELRHKKDPGKEDLRNFVVAAMLGSLKKKHLCDVELVGGDGVTVNAPDYLLAIHSSVIEGILYPVVLPSIQEDESEREGMDNFHSPPTSSVRKVDVPFATEPAISAALHFLVAQNLPTDLSDSRVMCQIYFIGKLFKINGLADEVCRQGRLMINKSSSTDMPEKVCAAFDECSALERAGEEHKWWNLSFGGINELKEYALECLLAMLLQKFYSAEAGQSI
jgi:hypothetical protein